MMIWTSRCPIPRSFVRQAPTRLTFLTTAPCGSVARRLGYVILLATWFIATSPHAAVAAFTFTHVGANDPLTEGFIEFSPGGTAGPVFDDLGRDAWSIDSAGYLQPGYNTGPFTETELNDIAHQGFTATMEVRAIQGSAPNYTDTNTVIAGVAVLLSPRRFDMLLGVDTNGDTVVVLPNAIVVGSAGQTIQAPGTTYTLVGSGSTYHTYELVYDPVTRLADLKVDGVTRLTDYPGHTSYAVNLGLFFGALSGGQGNYSLAKIVSVPEPSGFTWLAVAIASAWATRRRFIGRANEQDSPRQLDTKWSSLTTGHTAS